MDAAIPLLLFFALVLLPMIWAVATYNRLTALRNHCSEAWANIDTELKRRYELIPNLVATVRGYAAHERDVLEQVTLLREVCVADQGNPAHQAASENQLVEALNRLLVRVEAYPELKASEHFLALQRELSITEDRIQAARRFYNGNVRENNNLIEMFPSSVIAGMGNFPKRDFFELESTAFRQAPAVGV
jgi:LemA protein